ncbi:MAG: SHOCT domain-containing protein [Microbacteriaceae bacterium]
MISALAAAQDAHWMGPAGGFSPFFLLFPLFWIVIVVLVLGVFGRRWRRFGGGHPGLANGARLAEQTLAERFAQGDIEETEYRARLEVLRANRPAS